MKKKKRRAGLRILSLDAVGRAKSTSDKTETSISEEILHKKPREEWIMRYLYLSVHSCKETS